MNAILVSVDYADLLAVTLPYNRHHFSRVLIVTSPADKLTQELAKRHMCEVYVTDTFFAKGAAFNKWAALEEAYDNMRFREGWLCQMDADVLWPKRASLSEWWDRRFSGEVVVPQLVSPLRRMAPWPLPSCNLSTQIDIADAPIRSLVPLVPKEESWHLYQVHRNVAEWAGYSQIFHADDPHLGAPPWHEVDWEHAGGADSLFQRKWPADCKVRPPFEVLHLGEPGRNWYGRATPMADGTVPPESAERLKLCADIWARRRSIRAEGGTELDTFKPEKLNHGI